MVYDEMDYRIWVIFFQRRGCRKRTDASAHKILCVPPRLCASALLSLFILQSELLAVFAGGAGGLFGEAVGVAGGYGYGDGHFSAAFG